MREHLGEEYGGVVSSVTSFGIFVTLDAMYVEGLVHITELGGDYFRFDELRQELRGERTGMRYAIGTRLRVQVSRVDLDGRRIDFRLVHDGDALLTRAMKDKGLPRVDSGPVTLMDEKGGKTGKRRTKMAKESLARSPKSATRSLTAPAGPATIKDQDNRRKPRRRS